MHLLAVHGREVSKVMLNLVDSAVNLYVASVIALLL